MPGPPPRYRPIFPDEFLAEARRLVRARTAAFHLRQRAQLVLLLHDCPALTNAVAATRLDLHPNSIRLWRQRWAKGQFTLEDAPGRGRKPVFSPLQGERIDPFDAILSSDEKTSIQARIRIHASLPPEPGRHRRVEFEYERGGALQYLAAWDVQEGRVMGRCEAKTGIDSFGRLVRQVMERTEYARAFRVFWVVDNGSSHRGETSV